MPKRNFPTTENYVFHVMNRGNDHQTIFRSAADFSYFHTILKKYKTQTLVIFFYTIMPNHFHILLESRPCEDLSKYLHKVTLTYAHYFKRQYEHDGHVWKGRFKCKNINKDAYLLQCGLYIENNPVRANLVRSPEDYPWSSARMHLLGFYDPLVDACPYISNPVSNQVASN